MHPHSLIQWLGAFVLAVASCQLPFCAADDRVVIHLADGRAIRAAIDPRTDADRLWLATALDHGGIAQAICWEQVRDVEIAGQSYDGPVVHAAVAVIREAQQSPAMASDSQNMVRLDSSVLAAATGGPEPAPVQRPSRTTSKVQAMTVSARLGNWDHDVPVDGLVVEITLVDASGEPVLCNGSVEVRLHAWRTSGRDGQTRAYTERWTARLNADDFGFGSVPLRLPFRTIQTQEDSSWWSHGVLQVRVTVPGSGVIERSLTDVRLRPFEPARDMLEQRTGRRFFSSENVPHRSWSQALR